jgi:transposase
MDGKQLQQQYKHHISDYRNWEHKDHASKWLILEQNMGEYLSIDETALSGDELYTVVTNKAAKGRKGAIVAMVRGTKSEDVITVLQKISEGLRKAVKEVTLDMAANMHLIASRCFPHAHLVVDRFHVQQLASEAVQEIRIKYRWQELDLENKLIEEAKKQEKPYVPEVLANGDTPKQLLARARYLLFKPQNKWAPSQAQRADLLFERYPAIKKAYDLSQKLSSIFRKCTSKEQAFKKLALWYNEVEDTAIDSFRTVSRSIQTHYLAILNYFNNRNTNASAEAFNAKIKSFRSSARGVRDINFFLFRLAKIYG